jgi:hypothetical protein
MSDPEGETADSPTWTAIGLHTLLVAKANKQRRKPQRKCEINQFKILTHK